MLLTDIHLINKTSYTNHVCSLNNDSGKRLSSVYFDASFNFYSIWQKLSKAALLWLKSGSSPSVVMMLKRMKEALSLRSYLCIFQGKPGGLGSIGEKGPPGEPVSMMSPDVVTSKLCGNYLTLAAIDRFDT